MSTEPPTEPNGEAGGTPPRPQDESDAGPRLLQDTRRMSVSMPSLRPQSREMLEGDQAKQDELFINYLREQSDTIQLQLPALDDSETVDFEPEANMVRKMSRSMSGVLNASGAMLKPSEEYVQRLRQRLYSPQHRHSVSKPSASMKKNQKWPGASQTFPVVSFPPGTKTRSARLLGSAKKPGMQPRPMGPGYSPYTPQYPYPMHGQPSPGGYGHSPYAPPPPPPAAHMYQHPPQYSPYGGQGYPGYAGSSGASPATNSCAMYTGIVVNQWDVDDKGGMTGMISQIWARMVEAGMMSVLARLRGREVTVDEVLAVHSQAYAQLMTSVLDAKEIEKVNSITTARTAAGCVLEMALAVSRGELKNGFALVRPCGRRAQAETPPPVERFSVNNIGITVAALRRIGLRRFVIIDWDVEYVDATQRLFYEDPNVLCISVHRSSHPEEGKVLTLHGRPTERGAGAGEGFNVNVPWPREAKPGDAEYVYFVRNVAAPLIHEFQPDMVLVASGFSAAKGESEGFGVTPVGFAHMTKIISSAASGRVVFALEDGEEVAVVSECVLATLRALSGDVPPPLPSDPAHSTPSKGLLQVLEDAVESHVAPFRELVAASRRRSVASDMRGSASHEPTTPVMYPRAPEAAPARHLHPRGYDSYRSPYQGNIDTAENSPAVPLKGRRSGSDETLSPAAPARKFRSEEADMAESAAEALASLSVMATQHATADRPSDYAPDGHPGGYSYGGQYYGGYCPPSYPGPPPHAGGYAPQHGPHSPPEPYHRGAEGYPYPPPHGPGIQPYPPPPGRPGPGYGPYYPPYGHRYSQEPPKPHEQR